MRMHIFYILKTCIKKAIFESKKFSQKTFGDYEKTSYICSRFQKKRRTSPMTIPEFTNIFMPQLVDLYVQGSLPLHGLVDVDLWRRIYPISFEAEAETLHWNQLQLTCNPLQDGTLLLTFLLPQPLRVGLAKAICIRMNPQARGAHDAIIYTMCKPGSIFDAWDILFLPFPNRKQSHEYHFLCKVDGTDSLRNFILTVQQKEYSPLDYDKSWIEKLKENAKALLSFQSTTNEEKTKTLPPHLFAPV